MLSTTKASGFTFIVSPNSPTPINSSADLAARDLILRNEGGVAIGRVGRGPEAPYIEFMCGRVRLSSDYSEIKIKLNFDLNAPAPNFEADWNKPPTAPMLVAIRSEDGKRTPKMMPWDCYRTGRRTRRSPIQPSMRGPKSSRPNRHSGTHGKEANGVS